MLRCKRGKWRLCAWAPTLPSKGGIMFVKRIAGALRRQDWAAVAVEFLLVVAGVVLAFQITAWASERQAGAERAAATDRLLEESEQSIAYFQGGVAKQRQLVNDLDFALARVARGRWAPEDEARMASGFAKAINAAGAAPPTSV